MFKKLPIALLFLFFAGSSFAQDYDAITSDVRVKFQETRENLDLLNKQTRDLPRESTEGGTVTAYLDGPHVKMLEVLWMGETGKHTIEYYFHNGMLIFALDIYYEYNRPITWTKNVALENNDTEYFDPSKTTETEERYYFKNEQLFLWLDKENEAVDLTEGTNAIAGQGIIAHAYKMCDPFIAK